MRLLIKMVVAYLLVGVLVTMAFVSGRSMGMGGAGIIFIGPFIWPVMVVTMIGESISDRERAKAHDEGTNRQYEADMATCPPGYEVACQFYYHQPQSVREFQQRQGQAYEQLFSQLEAGNLPQDAEQLSTIRDMAHRLSLSEPLHEFMEKHSSLWRTDASPLVGYMCASILQRVLSNELEQNKQMDEPRTQEQLADELKALAIILSTYERYLAVESIPGSAPGMASLYQLYAKRLPSGPDRDRAEGQTARYFEQAALQGASMPEMWIGILGWLRSNPEWPDMEPLLHKVAESLENGRELTIHMDDCDALPSMQCKPEYLTSNFHPDDVLLKKTLPLMDSKEAQIRSCYYLLPILGKSVRPGQFGPLDWRSVMYDLFARDHDQGWLDVYQMLMADKYPEMAKYSLFFQAERAYLLGDKTGAEALLEQYFAQEESYAITLRTRNSYDSPPSWALSESGENFSQMVEVIKYAAWEKRRP